MLDIIRKALQKHQLDAYIINGRDPHNSEYPAKHWQTRHWVSGFTGSAGIVVITATEAALWSDFRYYKRAERELEGSDFTFYRAGTDKVPSYQEWLKSELSAGQKVGIDGWTITAQDFEKLEKNLSAAQLKLDAHSLSIDQLWLEDRPALPLTDVFELSQELVGKTRADKLNELRRQLRSGKYSHYLVCSLENIAWLLNLRAADSEGLPAALSFLLLGLESCHFFCEKSRVPKTIQKVLKDDGVDILPYTDIEAFCLRLTGMRVLTPQAQTNYRLKKVLEEVALPCESEDLLENSKAYKNTSEIKALRQAMIADGVALVRCQYWLEDQLAAGAKLSEYDVAKELLVQRKRKPDFISNSFDAIVGYLANAALPHYHPFEKDALQLKAKGLLLIDSGGHYLNGGTTDITRTWALGEVSEQQKRNYTLVLKAHIALTLAHFPQGARGAQLDGIARNSMWKHGLDYGHGTGHGVGFILGVHENPPNISSIAQQRFYAGMIVSNEPGVYYDDEYGIRIENLLLVTESDYFQDFLQFETLSICPYDNRLIEKSLFTQEEKNWLNSYHENCYKILSPWLRPALCDWLEERCQAFS